MPPPLDITIRQLDEMSALYADFSEQDREQIFHQILCKLTSFMTDRAAVMKKFDSLFLTFLRTKLGRDVAINFLHCKAHYFLGLSRVVETEMAVIEHHLVQESGMKMGRDADIRFRFFKPGESSTARTIWTVSDLTGPRGDQKNGCREDWMAYCDELNIKSLMSSYRSNRFNCLFQGAAAIVHHRASLQAFFPSLSHTNLKIQSAVADLADDRLMLLLCAVGMLYLRVTGPFWLLLQSPVLYIELWQYVNPLVLCMERWALDASDLLDEQFVGVFGGEFELRDDPLRPSLFACASTPDAAPIVRTALQQLMPRLLEVTRKQLASFITGEKYGGPPAETPQGMEHCPLTNLLGENVFGDLDYDISYRRHSSLHHRTSSQVMRHNRTAMWFASKNELECSYLLKFDRTMGRSLREQHRQQEKLVRLKLQEMRAENERQKLEKAALLAATKARILQRLREHGGPCESPADLDSLLQRLQNKKDGIVMEVVKDQLRFQKVILGHKQLRIGGSLQEISHRLRCHLHENQPVGTEMAVHEDHHHVLMQPEDAEPDDHHQPFSFLRQGEWVAVFFDDTFYIGQVLEVVDEQNAIIKYLQRTSSKGRVFKWPLLEDITETSAYYVFCWDLGIMPASNDGRLWYAESIEDIEQGYADIKRRG